MPATAAGEEGGLSCLPTWAAVPTTAVIEEGGRGHPQASTLVSRHRGEASHADEEPWRRASRTDEEPWRRALRTDEESWRRLASWLWHG
jgi:hypothetical protein